MAIDAGDVTYSIKVDTKDMIDAKREVNQFNQGINNTNKNVSSLNTQLTTLATTMASVFAAGQLTGFINQTVNAVTEQKNFADSINISFEQLQRLQFVAKKAGVEIDAFNDAIKEMVVKLEEANSGANEDFERRLERIGVNLSDIIALSPDQQFLKLADAMGNLATSTEKVLFANDFFGDEAFKVINVINQGSDAIAQQMKELDALGGVLSNEAAQGYKDFKNSLDSVGTSLNAVATQGIAEFSDEMKALSDAVKDFVADGENVKMVIDGIGIAAQATAVVIASRLVASFAALVAQQTAMVASSVAAAGGIRAIGVAGTAAAVGTSAMTAAAVGLRAALGFLGGPIGVAAAVAASLLLLNNTQDELADSTEELTERVDDLTVKYRALTKVQLAENLKESQERLSEVEREMNLVADAIRRYSEADAKGQTTTIDALANNDNINRLKELREEFTKLFQEVGLSTKIINEKDLAENVSKALKSITQTFSDEKISVDIDKLISLSGAAKLSGLNELDKLKEETAQKIKEIEEIYKGFGDIAPTLEKEKAKLDKVFAESTEGITDKEALGKLQSAYNARLEVITNFYKKYEGQVLSKEELITFIQKEEADKRKEIADKEAAELKSIKDELISLERSATASISSEREALRISYEESVRAIEEKYGENEDVVKEKTAALTALENKYVSDVQKIKDRENKVRSDALESLKKIEQDARYFLAEEDEKIAMDKKKALEELDSIYEGDLSGTEEYMAARAAIIEKYNRIQSDLEKQRTDETVKNIKANAEAIRKANEEAAKAEEEAKKKQQEKDTAFGEFAESFMEFTPMEMLENREKEAKERLDELYAESTASFEEYQQALTDIEKTFNKEREQLRQDEYAAIIGQTNMLLGATETILDGAAAAIQQAAGENSAAYKAMFALSKGFAVAQAGLNLTLAISNAMASGPFPWNLGAMATVASAGAGLVSSISGATYGRQNGGNVSAGNMYKVNESGTPEVYSYGNSDYLMSSQNAKITPMDQYMSQGGMMGSGVNISIINQVPNAEVVQQQGMTQDEVIFLIKETVPGEISNPNSKTSKALQSSTNANRKLK